jgi:RND family efflux transporter MFP subunit
MKRVSRIVLLLSLLGAGCHEDERQVGLDDVSDVSGATYAATPTTVVDADPDREPGASTAARPTGQPAAPARRSQGEIELGSMSASTEPRRRATVGPRVSDVVRSVAVEEGESVKRGQVLVQLDGTDYRLAHEQAEAARATAGARLEAARVEWQRLKRLVQDNAVPRSKLESMDAQMAVHRAALAQAEVGVKQARQRLRYTRVVAPFDAVVTKVFVEAGEHVTTMPPTRLVTLEQIDTLELRVKAPDTAIGRLAPGVKLQVRFPATGRSVRAEVDRVIPSLGAATRELVAIASLPNEDRSLVPGMFANASIVDGTTSNRSTEQER